MFQNHKKMTEVGIENVNFEEGKNSKYTDYIGTHNKYEKVFKKYHFMYDSEVKVGGHG